MANATLQNLKASSFVRTDPILAMHIGKCILDLPLDEAFNVWDPTSGEGDLFWACAHTSSARYFGSEISAERAAASRQRWPRATIVTSAYEAVSIPKASMDLLLINPPYFNKEGKRVSIQVITDTGEALKTDGIGVFIVTARSDLDATLVRHLLKWYDRLRVWKFPDRTSADQEGAFDDYTQIVIVGIRRATPATPLGAEKKRLMGYQWDTPKESDQSGWKGGEAPPDIPTAPLENRYRVPASLRTFPRLVVRNADEATLLYALDKSGAHLSPKWELATTWSEDGYLGVPAMPYTGEAHVASEVMIGGLDGEIVYGPGTGDDAEPHLFTAFIGQHWVKMPVDVELKEKLFEKGCISVELKQLTDKPILGVLNLKRGIWRYYQGEEVFAFLKPWLSTLASRVIEKRKPLYRLDPADWELRVASQFGTDKQLLKAPFPGLAVPQLHRVFATGRSLDVKSRIAIQGEPGVGKTRIAGCVAARQAYRWRYRNTEFRHVIQPAWIANLRRAWLKNPSTLKVLGLEPIKGHRVKGERCGTYKIVCDTSSGQVVAYREIATGKLVAPENAGPQALPVLVTTPLKVTREYGKEILNAFPRSEVIHIEAHRDIVRWFEQCATSSAPVIFGIFSHSTKKAFGREKHAVVHEKEHVIRLPVLDPPSDMLKELEPVYEGTEKKTLIAYRVKGTETLFTREERVTYYYCSDCGGRIHGVPDKKSEGKKKELLQDDAEPVTSKTWFSLKLRWCTCHTRRNQDRHEKGKKRLRAALWAEDRLASTNRKYPKLPFATWSAALAQVMRKANNAQIHASLGSLIEHVRRDDTWLEHLVTVALCDSYAASSVLGLIQRIDTTIEQSLTAQYQLQTSLANVLIKIAVQDEVFITNLLQGIWDDRELLVACIDGVSAHENVLEEQLQQMLRQLREKQARLVSLVMPQDNRGMIEQYDEALDPALIKQAKEEDVRIVPLLTAIQEDQEAIIGLICAAAMTHVSIAHFIIEKTLLPENAFAALLVELVLRDYTSLEQFIPRVVQNEGEVKQCSTELYESKAQVIALVIQAARRDGSHRILTRLIEVTRTLVDWQPIFFQSTWDQLHFPGGSATKPRQKKGKVAARGLCLSPMGEGPIVIEEPDLHAVDGYESIQDEMGAIIAYQLGLQGHFLVPRYGIWSRRIVDYVDAETGLVVTKKTSYGFRLPPSDSFSPYQYLYDFYKGCVALSVIDESHNGRGRDTDISQAHRQAMRAAQTHMLSSGTHYGGDILSFFHYWFSFNPQFWLRLGFGWNDAEKALARYGVIQQWTEEYESEARKGSGKTDIYVRTVAAPGLSANIIPGLLEDLAPLTVLDVGAYMPPKIEIPKLLPMRDVIVEQRVKEAEQAHSNILRERVVIQQERRVTLAQPEDEKRQQVLDEIDQRLQAIATKISQVQQYLKETHQWADARDLAGTYERMVKYLEDLAEDGNKTARLALGTIPRWFPVIPCDLPFEIYQTQRGQWGDKQGRTLLYRTPVLAWDHLYPLERWLIETVRKELAEGRRLMLYVEQIKLRSVAKRLQWVLNEFSTWILPDTVEAEDRQQAIIDAVEAGHSIIIVQYQRVNEGLNLQKVIDTIIWVELAMNLFMYIQASQRAWRLGKEGEVRIYLPVYVGTAGHSKVRKLGGQSGAAAAFAGEPPKGALVEHAGADQTSLARLAASLEAENEKRELAIHRVNLDEESAQIEADFARRNEELREALSRGRQFFGLVDTVPERLATIIAAHIPDVWAMLPPMAYLPEEGKFVFEAPMFVEVPAIDILPIDAVSIQEEPRETVTEIPLPSPSIPLPMVEIQTVDKSQDKSEPVAIEHQAIILFGDDDDIRRARERKRSRPRRTTPRPKSPTLVKTIPALVENTAEEKKQDEMVLHSIWDIPFDDSDAASTSGALVEPPLHALWAIE